MDPDDPVRRVDASDNLWDAFHRRVARHPGRFAVGFLGSDDRPEKHTYGSLYRAACGASRALAAAGVRPGDAVLIAADTGLPAVSAFLGCVALRALPVLTAPWSGGFGGGRAYLERLDREREAIAARRIVAADPLLPRLEDLRPIAIGERELSAAADSPAQAPRARPEDLCNLQFTSGSTGRPRAIRVTHANVLANDRALSNHAGSTASDVMVCWLPLSHDMGLHGALLHPLLRGMPFWLLDPRRFVRRPAIWLESIQACGATMTIGPNFSFEWARRALTRDAGGPHLDTLRMVFNGAEPIRPETLDGFLAAAEPHGFPAAAMGPCYGLGEATLAVTLSHRGEGIVFDEVDPASLRRGEANPSTASDAARHVSCGSATLGNEVTVVDDDGAPLPDRRVGEIVVSGVSVCDGYLADDSAGANSFRSGRLHTGDLGYLAGGRLFVVGRRKELLIVRGQNFSPVEIEWAAESVDGVRSGHSAAFSVPDPEQGTERVVLLCRAETGGGNRTALVRRVAGRVLESTGLAVEVRIVPSRRIPKTPSGKVRRGAARGLYLRRLERAGASRAEG